MDYHFEDEYEEDNRSRTAILQTSRHICSEARTVPLKCNLIRFSDIREMAEFTGYMDVQQLNAVNRIEVHLEFDWDCIRCWGMLKLLPKLSYLRLCDVYTDSDKYTRGHYALVGSRIKELRGLANLEILLGKEYAQDPEKYSAEIAQANQLAETWKSFVTQRKPEA